MFQLQFWSIPTPGACCVPFENCVTSSAYSVLFIHCTGIKCGSSIPETAQQGKWRHIEKFHTPGNIEYEGNLVCMLKPYETLYLILVLDMALYKLYLL